MIPATVNDMSVVSPHHSKKNENLTDEERGQILRSAQHFESLLVNIMFTTMRKTIADGGLIEKSNAEEIFTSFLDTEFSKTASTSTTGGMGLAGMMYEQLTGEPLKHAPSLGDVSQFDSRLSFGFSGAPERFGASQPLKVNQKMLEDFYLAR